MRTIPGVHFGIAGFMRLQAVNEKTGFVREDTGWFQNLVTDQGLDALPVQADVMTHFHVGTSSTAPDPTDTWLNAWLATGSTIQAESNGVGGSGPYYGYRRKTVRFAAGVATGNLSEAAVGWSATSGTAFAHTLIQDGGGSPTTITVLSDEYLDFTYELRYYAPTTDATGTISISGVSYNFTTRALNVTSTLFWATYVGKQFYELDTLESYHRAYAGALGAVTAGQPSGSDGGSGSGTTNVTRTTYVPGDYFMNFVVTATPTNWNVTGGVIKSVVLSCRGCRFQTELAKVSDGTGVSKTTGNTFTMSWRVSWARA